MEIGPTSSNVILGSGEVADRIRRKDWSATALGPLSSWSPALITSINMVLSLPTPAQLMWGPQMIVLYNDPFIPILTHKHPQALGLPGSEVWAEVWPEVGPQLAAVLSEGRSYDFRDLPLEILDHGRREQQFFTFTYSPMRDAEGRIVGLLNLSQNTTAAVTAKQALQKSEHRFRTLIDHASVGVAIGNTLGELTYLNPALQSLLGYTADEVRQGHVRWDQLTPPQYADLDARAIDQLLTSGIAEPYEKAYFNKAGEPVPLLIGAFVIPARPDSSDEGDIAVFATDLRKQKRAEVALLQAEKLAAVGKLASSISHEINNPLEAVINLLYIVRQDPNLAQSSLDFLATADRELARVSQVTSQTLRFHRQSTAPQNVAPEALIDEVLQLYSNRLANSGIKIRREYTPGVLLTCFEGDIRQVLNNLVGNAVDAMRAGGRLVIRTRNSRRFSSGAQGVLITIADTGSGMTPEVRHRIFDAFYTTKGINGTGLGLWISCRIVHKHRGYIRAYSSTGRRHGTIFHLWLPLLLAASASEPWHQGPDPGL